MENTRHSARSIILLVWLLLLPHGAGAADTAADLRAKALGDTVRCVVCQSQSINDSAADMAKDMRALIHDKVAAGWSDAQIVDYLRSRYGDFILLNPPVQANTWALWLAPWLFLAFACGLGIYFILKRRS